MCLQNISERLESLFQFTILWFPFCFFRYFPFLERFPLSLGWLCLTWTPWCHFLLKKNSLYLSFTNLQKVVLLSNLILQNPFLVVQYHGISFSPVVQFDTWELSWGLLLLGSWIWCDQYGSHCLCLAYLPSSIMMAFALRPVTIWLAIILLFILSIIFWCFRWAWHLYGCISTGTLNPSNAQSNNHLIIILSGLKTTFYLNYV